MAIMQMITTRNAAFQRFETIKRNRAKRTAQKICFVEGVHPIEQAIAHHWRFHAIAYADGARLSGWAQDMIGKADPEIIYRLSPALHAELSDRESPCELIALIHQREDQIARLTEKGGGSPLYLLFDRPQSPGNLGTVLRSADAFCIDGLITTGHSADFYDPQCIRASIGTVFALPFAAMESASIVLNWIDSLPVRPQIVGTSARGDRMIHDVDFEKPTLLLIGNETFGLSKAWKDECDLLAKIPIGGSASSLNAGCAASICLYEAAMQRGEPVKPAIHAVP